MDNAYGSCVICAGTELVALPRFGSAHLVRCASCHLTFAGRRPSDVELAEHYRGYGSAWRDSEITRSRYRELLDSFEPFRKSNRILDMGCGAGYFLEEAAKRGWDAYGSEFGDLPLELSRDRGLTVVPAPLARDAFPPGHFDVVTSFEVVEHLRDPLSEAATLANLVRTGGLFYCTTPNFNALSRHLLGPRWEAIGYPEHLNYFTPRTITSWLRGFGFRQIELATTGLSPGQLLQHLPLGARRQAGAAGVGSSGVPDLDARVRAAAESKRVLQVGKAALNRSLTLLGAGDTLKARFVFEG